MAAKGYELRPVLEIGNTDVILKFLLSNIGISFLPYFVVRQLVESGELSIIHLDNISIQMWSQLAYHKNKLVTPQMKKFMDLMIKHTST
ncbi:LysR substrate binding domain protein [compost metagenome]